MLSLFSGIGAFEKALENLQIPHRIVGYSEIDKYASKAYELIHNIPNSLNLGDITKIDAQSLPEFDMLSWGFPCQDISVAGHQKGITSNSRSGLYFDGLRILRATLPKYSIIENVKNLVSKKFKPHFDNMLQNISDLGYNNYYKVLNAKDYGIPQSRERVFIISIRKDVDNGHFSFPEAYDNGLRLKDMLEDNVDEKYFISEEKTRKLIESLQEKEYSNSIRVGGRGSIDRHQWDLVCVGNVHPSGKGMNGCVYDSMGLAPTITTNKGEGSKIAIPCLTPDRVEKRQNGRRFKKDGEPMFTLTGQDRHGVLTVGRLEDIKGHDYIKRVYSDGGLSPTIPTCGGGSQEPKILTNLRIRKLTPKECWRLMGFEDTDINKCIEANISNSQLYKMSGNSIVVNVLEEIFKKLFERR